MNDTLRIIVFSGCALLLWGIWAVAGKTALLRGMPPKSVFLFELAVGALLGLLILAVGSLGGRSQPWDRPWNAFGLLSGVALVFGLFFFYHALENARLGVVVTATSLYPVVAVFLGVVLLHERPTRLQWLAISLAVLSLLLLLVDPIIEQSDPAATRGEK